MIGDRNTLKPKTSKCKYKHIFPAPNGVVQLNIRFECNWSHTIIYVPWNMIHGRTYLFRKLHFFTTISRIDKKYLVYNYRNSGDKFVDVS